MTKTRYGHAPKEPTSQMHNATTANGHAQNIKWFFSLWAYPSPNTIPSCLPLPSSSPMIDPMMIHPSFHMAPPSGQAINLVKDLIQRCCIPEEAKGSWSEGPMPRILPQKAIVAVWAYLSLPALQSWSGWHHTLPPTLSPIVQLSCSPDASVSPIFAMWTPLL